MIRAVQRYVKEVKRATTPRGIEFTEKLLLWDFKKEETLHEWSCTSDEEVKGLSKATFEPNGKGDPLCLIAITAWDAAACVLQEQALCSMGYLVLRFHTLVQLNTVDIAPSSPSLERYCNRSHHKPIL